ncbi:MAG: DUF2497 domain-containing protein [Rickettsiales bacterium]
MSLGSSNKLQNYDDGSFLNLNNVVTGSAEENITINDNVQLNEQENDEANIAIAKDLEADNSISENSEPWQEVIKKELEEFTVIKNNDSILDKDNLNIDLDEDFGLKQDQLSSEVVQKTKENHQELENNAVKSDAKSELAEQINNVADAKSSAKKKKKLLSVVNEEQEMPQSLNNPIEEQEKILEQDNMSDQLISDDILSSSKEKINNLRKKIAQSDELSNPYNLDLSLMIKPMIKEWLEDNLPKIVEKIVRKEIKKITE